MTASITKSFTAFEYHKDACFYPADYRYEGSTENGWNIYRNNQHYLTLPAGYLLLKTLCCGICSTDIARHNLPFPLPQITGHEVVALYNHSMVVVDINAAHKHLGNVTDCEYCSSGLENHCPERLTLGIDRLPGGFAPYILVPIDSVISLPEKFEMKLASIIEPFAAALHAVETESIQPGDRVAIVGPRRLGSLLILALKLWREKNNINFDIVALIRGKHVSELCELAGADEIIDITESQLPDCDIVFDTSGSTSGFELALRVAKRVVHVKTTNGKAVFGLKYLTEMVISEFNLLPIDGSDYSSIDECLNQNKSPRILLDKNIADLVIKALSARLPDSFIEIYDQDDIFLQQPKCLRNRFDVAIGVSIDFINNVIQDETGYSLLKPRGNFFLMPGTLSESPLKMALTKGVKINTSRCGDFSKAIELLDGNLSANLFLDYFISGVYSSADLPEVFEKARSDRDAIKLLIEHV